MFKGDVTKVMTGVCRASYVSLFVPKVDKNSGKEKFSLVLLLPKTDAASKAEIDAAISEAAKKGLATKWNGVAPPNLPTPIHDGDGVKQSGEPYGPECKGHWVFTASTNKTPMNPTVKIVDANNAPIPPEHAGLVYSGMYCRAIVTFSAYVHEGKKGIGCYLAAIQKIADGERLGSGMSDEDLKFGELPAGYQSAPSMPSTESVFNPLTGTYS